jgi:hypothetical protein
MILGQRYPCTLRSLNSPGATTMNLDTLIETSWADHAAAPADVANRLQLQSPALLATASPAQLSQLANLAHHVWGEHLGHWASGLQFLQQLGAHTVCVADAEATAAVQRCIASLSLAAGDERACDALGVSDHIRATAMAAASLSTHNTPRALALSQAALTAFGAALAASSLANTDPCTRALAVTHNNLASALEEQTTLSDDERALMLHAALTARRFWGLAGGWLEAERAEYRLAKCHLKAGSAAQALVHAQHCFDTVAANGSVALETFFACEALLLAQRAAGQQTAAQSTLTLAQAAFTRLNDDDRTWCQATLDAL